MKQELENLQKKEIPAECRLEKISRIIVDQLSGFACAINTMVKNDGYVHLRPFNIEESGKLNLNILYRVPIDMVDTGLYVLKKGDILFNNTNSKELVGKSILVDKDYPYAFSNHVNRLRVDTSLVTPTYFQYYLRYAWIKGHFARNSKKWIGQAGYTINKLKEQVILLPPLQIQQNIADKLEMQMVSIEMMKKEAEEQMEAANNYYRSYLLKVFSEKDNWQYKKFGDLFDTKYGLSKPSVKDSTKTNTLRMTNITYEGELTLDDICYLDLSDNELKQHKLKKNDLIFNRTNSADLVGKTTVFDQEDTFVAVSYLVVATPKTPEINSKFVSYYLNTSEMKKYFVENCDKAISQANFSASKLCEIQIPTPEKKTQDKIVALIQTAKTELMRVSEPLKSQLNAINQLPASILNEVFGQYQINS